MHITLMDSRNIRRTLSRLSIGRYFNHQEILVICKSSEKFSTPLLRDLLSRMEAFDTKIVRFGIFYLTKKKVGSIVNFEGCKCISGFVLLTVKV